MGVPLTSRAFNEAVAKGGWTKPGPCQRTHAANLPGVISLANEGDFVCANCAHDLGVRGCIGCCKQRFASDFFDDDPCAVGGEVDHGCCYHDEERDVVDIRGVGNLDAPPATRSLCPCQQKHDHHRQSPPSICCAGREWRLPTCPADGCNCAACTGKEPCPDDHPTYGLCCEVKGHFKQHVGINGGAWPRVGG
jgi:hypothetical protein